MAIVVDIPLDEKRSLQLKALNTLQMAKQVAEQFIVNMDTMQVPVSELVCLHDLVEELFREVTKKR